ncbi:MAG: PEP-CTERM sorting domain-containing protein [Acidobacteriia bacterium]|nr:PEP-CTERM sorting domain-containing protein [Terriglobia bacterium]
MSTDINSQYLVDGVIAGVGEVPEPATAGMVAMALVALAGQRKFRRG